MSAVTGGTSKSERNVVVIGKALAWIVLVGVLLELNAERAQHDEDADQYFRQGYAIGGTLMSLALGFGAWAIIQRGIRKRRLSLSPMVGVLALPFALALMLLDVGGSSTKAAAATCAPAAQAFGRAPAGWRYKAGAASDRAQVVKLFKLQSVRGTEVRFAVKGRAGIVMVAVPHFGESYVRGAEHSATKAGATISKAHGADVFDYPANKARTMIGVRGCNAVVIGGRPDAAVDEVGAAVFS